MCHRPVPLSLPTLKPEGTVPPDGPSVPAYSPAYCYFFTATLCVSPTKLLLEALGHLGLAWHILGAQ